MNWKRIGCSFVLTLTALTTATRAEGYALVIGVNECPEFRLPDGSRPKPLRGAESDADAMAEVLRGVFGFAPGNMQVLKGRDATHVRIQTAFRAAARKLKSSDVFVFYFSGHGTQILDQPPLDEPDGLDEALCAYDTATDGRNLVIDDELGVWLDDLPAGHVTAILDCCHAGTGTKDFADDLAARYLPMPIPNRLAVVKPKEPWRELCPATKSFSQTMTALFACRPEQQAYERRLPHQTAPARSGQFTYYLLEGMKDQRADTNHDGTITNQELTDYVQRRLDETFNRTRLLSGDREEPLLEGRGESPVFGIGTSTPAGSPGR